jgi:tetratricopeptide (TPR) repeat protein
VIDDANPLAKTAVQLDAVKIQVVLNAPLAQTTVTLRFRNTMSRQLEGTLEFPLPENAAVVGYALDVPAGSGTLVEGVCVEKERARRIFESEQRRGVDPGRVEQTRGNNYRTRVHPIPAGGTRTVQLTYVSDMVDVSTGAGRPENLNNTPNLQAYTLPLNFTGGAALQEASLRVEAPGLSDPRALSVQGLPNLVFESREGGLVAEKEFANVSLSGALTLTQAIPADGAWSRVETRTKPRSVENVLNRGDGAGQEAYFMISAVVPKGPGVTPATAQRGPLSRIGIVWDTSLSRATADRTGELGVLRGLAARSPGATFQVFGTDGVLLKRSAASETEALVAYLKDLPCDGALRIDGLRQKLANDRVQDMGRPQPEIYLFFTDGLITLGSRELGPAEAPFFTVSSDPRSDHGVLRGLAESAGGQYLNLQRLSVEQAVGAVLAAPLMATLTWEQDKPAMGEVYPAESMAVTPGQRITFTGRLLLPEVTVTLRIGERSQQITLKKQGASSSGMVPRFWAQQKAVALGRDAVRNGDALLALGKDFGIVTPQTSLLVLETADQYVQHRVVPPQSAKGLYDEFVKRIEAESNLAKAQEQEKIDRVLAMWNRRVAWWGKEFAPPTPAQLAAAKAKATRRDVPSAASSPTDGTFGDGNMTTGVAPQTPAPVAAPRREARLQEGLLSDIPAVRAAAEVGKDSPDGSIAPQATLTIKAWSPDTPYLRALKSAKPEDRAGVYFAQRKEFQQSPAFYLDCANYFLEAGEKAVAVRILTNIAQLHLEDAALLRIAAYRLLQIGEYGLAIDLFEQAKALRPDEPQSWRDLAQATAERAQKTLSDELHMTEVPGHIEQVRDLVRALELYKHVVMNKWDRFEDIELVALMEANALWADMQRLPAFDSIVERYQIKNPLDPRLVKNLDCDLRIVMTWDADVTDIDLHVVEPSTEEAFYGYNLTLSGGMVSRDFTQGYGPEEYVIHHAPKGAYKIMANYYGSQQQSVQGPVTVQATVITNFGRPTEERKSLTLRLTDQKETVTVGEVRVEGGR